MFFVLNNFMQNTTNKIYILNTPNIPNEIIVFLNIDDTKYILNIK